MAGASPSTQTGVGYIDELVAAIEAEADRLIDGVIAEMRKRFGTDPTGLSGPLAARWIELGRYNAAFAALKVLDQRGLLAVPVHIAAVQELLDRRLGS